MNKADFLANIRTRLHRAEGEPASARSAIGVPDFFANRTFTPAQCTERFIESFTGLAGELECFDTEAQLLQSLDDFLTELGPNRIGSWGEDAEWPISLQALLDKWDAIRWDETTPQDFQSVDVSVTGCAYAIADTGTIVMTSSPAQGRGVHVLPSVHVVVMREDQIVLRLGEVFASLTGEENRAPLPASVHFVSGASRSSDIENDQSIGVHGPARVVVMLLRG